MTELTPEQLAKLPKRVVRTPSPPSIQDPAAHLRLHSEISGAARRLEKLGTDPIAIAASPNRFNDIYWSDWRAIRFGAFFTERHDYGGRRNYDGDLRDGPSGARAARDALDRLEAADWRDLFADAFGVPWSDQVLALVLQDGLPWLVFSGSNFADENNVFALWGGEPIRYFGAYAGSIVGCAIRPRCAFKQSNRRFRSPITPPPRHRRAAACR
jgi:hypothetical protein